MELRKLGKSSLKVSEIIMGAWAIGGWKWGGTDDDAAIAAIRESIDAGVTSIDTAPVYGFGHSESVIGKAIAGRRNEVQLLTKFGLVWDSTDGMHHFDTTAPDGTPLSVYRNARKESIMRECEQSLRNLGTDYIDLYQCHWPDTTVPFAEMMLAMEQLIKEGKILAAGVSNFTPEMLDQCLEPTPVASVQPPYSMIKRNIEQELLPYCIEHEIGVIVYSPLERGLLTGKVTMDRVFSETDARGQSPYFRHDNRQRVLDFLAKIKPIADGHNATLAQLVINWTIHRPGITAALVGARNPQQARENAGAAAFTLTAAEIETINKELEQLVLEGV